MPEVIYLKHDPADAWAEVELFRWQYGELPGSKDTRELNVSAGLKGMALAIELGCKTGNSAMMPTPNNVCEVLKYCARRLKQ